MKTISWNEFEQVDIRVGTITRVEDFPEARNPAYKVWVDLGELGMKKSSAQITKLYKKEDLLDRQVLCVVNFPPKQIANFLSEVLIAGFYRNEGEVVLAIPDQPLPNGSKLA